MKNYFPALTGIRAVAAAMVVILHMTQRLYTPGLPLQKQLAVEFVQQWHIGVVIFFVLSGFLIATRYMNRIEPTAEWFRFYMQNRFARIYPIYFLLTAFAFGLMLVRPTNAWWEWQWSYTQLDKTVALGLNLTLLRAYFEKLTVLGVPTAWSLTVEETFYLCAPLILLSLKHNARRLLFYPFLFLAIGAALVYASGLIGRPYELMASMRFMLNMTFFGRCTEFLLGIGLALVVAKKSAENQPGAIYTMVGALGIVFYMAIVTFANHGRVQLGGPAFWLPYQILANNFLLPAVVCSLFYGLVKEQTALRRLLETPLFDLLGKSSYILYLIHLGAVDSLFRQYISDNSVICFIVYLLLSIVLYKTVEHPLHTRLRAKPRPKLAVG